ncbi:hypothetical protein NA57DRAFT_76313 [Rhizodiscina lignyota]|uniref:Uncharacterized protein n=1 Tax=Rhizodiscina lignyota TaxID=1504668 RepID=A0A9P4IH50_9PEZI|nr:hypothetical protein NA57DRAFT_76313 [Rhizodiscina lignyota]
MDRPELAASEKALDKEIYDLKKILSMAEADLDEEAFAERTKELGSQFLQRDFYLHDLRSSNDRELRLMKDREVLKPNFKLLLGVLIEHHSTDGIMADGTDLNAIRLQFDTKMKRLQKLVDAGKQQHAAYDHNGIEDGERESNRNAVIDQSEWSLED